MTATQQFIEDAIKSGYSKDEQHAHFIRNLPNYALCQIWLDPLAWQAVGKTRGLVGIGTADIPQSHFSHGWRRNWHRFIDHLADGKTIEEALSLI